MFYNIWYGFSEDECIVCQESQRYFHTSYFLILCLLHVPVLFFLPVEFLPHICFCTCVFVSGDGLPKSYSNCEGQLIYWPKCPVMMTAECKWVDSVTGTTLSLRKDKSCISLCVKRWVMSRNTETNFMITYNCGFPDESTHRHSKRKKPKENWL